MLQSNWLFSSGEPLKFGVIYLVDMLHRTGCAFNLQFDYLFSMAILTYLPWLTTVRCTTITTETELTPNWQDVKHSSGTNHMILTSPLDTSETP